MLNVVYLLVFKDREQGNIFPCYYIGSKSNCIVSDGSMYTKGGKIYYGSSTHKDFKLALKNEIPLLFILFKASSYQEALEKEKSIHINYDVAANICYFNKIIATTNNYSNPEYATYKHTVTGDFIRLPRNHPKVVSGEYRGTTYGNKLSAQRIEILRKYGIENNHFKGKHHKEETISVLREKALKRYETYPELKELSAKRCRETFKGKKLNLTDEQRRNRSNAAKSRAIYKNIITGESKAFKRGIEDINIDRSVWVNPYAFSLLERKKTGNLFQCIHCGLKSVHKNNINRWHNDNCKFKGKE